MSRAIQIVQLSDTHFLEEGADPEGGHSYHTGEAFDAVLNHLGAHGHIDMVVVTGDIADHGRVDQYQRAADAFARFAVPVNVCPGNHDLEDAFGAAMARPGVATSRVVEAGPWAFLFVDSSAGMMVAHPSGHLVDPPGEERLHGNGSLGEREREWVRRMCASTAAEHVFVWVHHPPAVEMALSADAAYTAEWRDLLEDLPMVRGLGGGHTHVPEEFEFAGRPVFVAPSLKNNFDLDAGTWLPPGYRTFVFHPDGQMTSDLHLVDDDRWPRRPLGRALTSLFSGELTFEQLQEIVARRSAAG